MPKMKLKKLHKKEERLHHTAEKAMKSDEKVHKKIERAEKKEDKKEERAKKAMKHPDKLGEGARKRKALPAKEKVGVVMKEFKRGTLNSGSGEKVSNPKQAIAIALSEARRAGAKIPKKKKK